ncbi:RHS repeat-associated core domain-containing protein [Leifsonia sp. F6_8S_P_1B]|uniref:RHS repeat-associated core domain-containing protein n=1 Tax=Leifsonia williamsii TaxID=3035919 RepID=A0ABT8KA25_9MICO|nr:RHS repeat-associated core domain-containing protein [Leifsonia williamsii]MDN4613897.1 RHS repeat-associated core domain-containing protein [Leifsonia williamsii]
MVAAATLTAAGTVTPAQASPQELARRVAAATLAEVRAAAAVQSARLEAETEAPAPTATGRIDPGKKSTVDADGLGVSATFSGNKVDSALDVAVGAAPTQALRAAKAERPGSGTPVSDPVQITATDPDGKQVTQFPPKAVNTRGGGDKGPVVSDVVPGVSLELKPDLALVEANHLNPATLQIYTRETAGEPWTALPSFYDAKAGVVRGESTHLSQFVVIGIPFPVPARPVVVLDPDNDEGHASTPAPPVTEWAYNQALAAALKSRLEADCLATVAIANTGPDTMLSRATRAGIAAAQNPTMTVGIGFNTNQGTAWGSPSDGGSQLYSRGGAADDALSNALVGVLPNYTGRPAVNKGNNGNFPGTDFDGVPGALTHLEALFMDHNYDRPVIDNGMGSIADGVLTGLGVYLQSQGFSCVDPATGGWPTAPSAATLARWRQLGHQNHQTYGGEPFSFSTGNLVEDEKLFSLPGPGGSSTEVTLTYNSQDGRPSRVGAGWSFGLGARAQRFIDGSVLVERGDGASFVFTSDGHGGYVSDPTLHQTLTEAGAGRLTLTDVSGESWVFDAADIDGIGELVSHTDATGHTTTLAYGPADPDVNQFVPLTGITDSAGQTIVVQSDAQGRVVGFTRPGGDHWSLSYNAAGDLTQIALPDGRTHTFTYDGAHQLLTGTDATGTTYLKNEYDAAGRIIHQWDAAGDERSLDYSTVGQTAYTDNLGRRSVFFYDTASRITKVQHPDGTTATFRFDAQNNVISSTDENGAKTIYGYDSFGNLTAVTGADGLVTKYTYTPTGLVATKTDTGGPKGAARTWTYDHNDAGAITAVHQPDGTVISNSYDGAGNLIAVSQPSGATTTCSYDAPGNLTSATDPDGNKTTYTYDSAGRMLTQTSPAGHTTAYAWDSGDRVVTATNAVGGVFAYGWEPNDHLASLTDPTGAVTTYTWDALFHLTSTTSPTGGVTKYGYTAEDVVASTTDPLGAVTTDSTDSRDRVVKTVDPNGGVWTAGYDGVGNLTSTTSPTGAKTTNAYDSDGRLLSSTGPTGGKTAYTYDSVGRLTKQTDPDGVSTSYAYDVMDRVTRITDGLGKHTDLGYDVDGNLTSVTDRQGNTTGYRYDAAGHVTSQTSPLGEVTSYGYDPDGNVTTVTDPLGRATTYTYTALGQLASTTGPAGNRTAYTYDAAGRTQTVTDPNGHTTSFGYDKGGNQTSVTDPTGAITGYGWDAAGRQTSTTDPEGHQTVYGYDPAGQLVKVTEGYTAGAKPGPDVNVVSEYGYDPDGNLTSTTDPNGHTTTYAVDPAGQTTKEVNPVGNTTAWAYTPAGRLASTTNGNGQTTAFGYDKRGDLTRQNQAGAVASYEYNANQQLIAMTDPTGVSGWTYDKDGRTTTQIDQRGGHLATSYDKASQVAGMTLPTGEKLAYTYDTAGNLTSQTSPWGSLTYGWDGAANLTRIGRSSGVTTSYGYDADNRVTSVLHQTPAPAGAAAAAAKRAGSTPAPVPYGKKAAAATCTTVAGYLGARTAPAGASNLCKHADAYLDGRTLPTPANPVADGGALGYQYGYDKDGNLIQATRTISPPTVPHAPSTPTSKPTAAQTSYAYDGVDRLSTSTTKAGEKNTYRYDPAGNRVGWTRTGAKDGNFTQTAAFNNADQLTSTTTSAAGRGVAAGTATYSYDGAGQRTNQSLAGVSTGYGYNPAGQTTRVTRPGLTTTYSYDGLGRTAATTDETAYGAATTANTYDGSAVVQTKDQQGTSTLIRDAAGSLAEHVTATGDATWDLLDGLGSTIAGSRNASITQLASYDDWGGQNFDTSGWSAPEGYTAHAQDPTQNLVHTYARSYDPAAGAWTSPDSWRGLLTQPKSLARYRYAFDNPTSYLDPDGHRCAARSGGSDALPLGCGAPAVQAYNNVKMPPPPAPYIPAKRVTPIKPKPTGPTAQDCIQQRHLDSNYIVPTMKIASSGKKTCGAGIAPTLCNRLKDLPTKPAREFGQVDGKKALELWAVVWDGVTIVGEVYTGSISEQDVGSFGSDLYDYLTKSYAPAVIVAPGRDSGQWTIWGPTPPGGLS